MLHWWKYQRNLSAFKDHALSPEVFRSVWSHLYHCWECREAVDGMEELGDSLRRLPSPEIPPGLVRDLRCAISLERARQERPGWLWRVRNQWGHLALPGTAGLTCAILFFGLFASQFSVSPRRGPDVPLDLRTSAYLRNGQLLAPGSPDSEMVVQLLIDHRGRVADYRIVAGTYTPEDLRRFRHNLLFAVFEPAMVFGKPVSENLVLVTIRG